MRNLFLRILFLFPILAATAWCARNLSIQSILAFLVALATYSALNLSLTNQETKTSNPRFVADEKLFRDFLNLLPEEGSIRFLRLNAGTIPFEKTVIDQLKRFDRDWRSPHHKFHSRKLNRLRVKLLSAIEAYFEIYMQYIFNIGDELYGIPPEWHDHPERLSEAHSALKDFADKVLGVYDNLVRAGKNKFG